MMSPVKVLSGNADVPTLEGCYSRRIVTQIVQKRSRNSIPKSQSWIHSTQSHSRLTIGSPRSQSSPMRCVPRTVPLTSNLVQGWSSRCLLPADVGYVTRIYFTDPFVPVRKLKVLEFTFVCARVRERRTPNYCRRPVPEL